MGKPSQSLMNSCCLECLFQPSLIGMDCVGVHGIMFNSIMECGSVIHKGMVSNTVVGGGSLLASPSCFPHMCVSSKDYDECGPRIVDNMCLS